MKKAAKCKFNTKYKKNAYTDLLYLVLIVVAAIGFYRAGSLQIGSIAFTINRL